MGARKLRAQLISGKEVVMAKQSKEESTEQRGLTQWKPFAEMASWEGDMERLFGNFLQEEHIRSSTIDAGRPRAWGRESLTWT
jgi:hypothetical protein